MSVLGGSIKRDHRHLGVDRPCSGGKKVVVERGRQGVCMCVKRL